MRRDAFDRAGGFCEQLISAEDIHFWLLMREQGTFAYVPEALAAKTEYELFPKVLERDPGAPDFAGLIPARYGPRAPGLVDCGHQRVRAALGQGHRDGVAIPAIRPAPGHHRHLPVELHVLEPGIPRASLDRIDRERFRQARRVPQQPSLLHLRRRRRAT